MVRVAPFPAVRPHPSYAARIASVPYDVVNTEEARALAQDNPLSFLHVVRPEIDLPADTSPYDDAVYAKGLENLEQLLADGNLVADGEPRIFLYRQVMNHVSQVGIVCRCHIEDYLENRIRKHELTRQDKEDDRTRHVQTLAANTGPVFLTYRDDTTLESLIAHDCNARPLYHFDAPDGVTHTVWPVSDPQPYVDAFAALDAVYVADGHHRSASAARAGAERRAANPDHTGEEPYNWFLSVLFAASSLHILPYHRVIRDLGDLTPADVLEKLATLGTVAPTTEPGPTERGQFDVLLEGTWHRVTIDPGTIDHSDAVSSLDVALVHDRFVGPVLGIEDIRNDPRIGFVGGIRGIGELERLVESGAAAMAIAMHATSIDELLAVSDDGAIMPPKSTWFEPKLRSGLFVHRIGDPMPSAPSSV